MGVHPSYSVVPRDETPYVITLPYIGINSYEVLTFIIAALLLFGISRKRQDLSLVMCFALGFAVSSSVTFFILRPKENPADYTMLGWIAVLGLTGVLMRSNTIDALYSDLKRLFFSFVKDRGN
jgi:NADH:ubiquinone oxidoreductase subunit K